MWHFHIANDDIIQQNLKTFIWSFSFFILVSQCLRSAEQWIMTCLNVSQFFTIHHINIKPARKFLKAHIKIQIYLALALDQFPPKWKPHNIRTSKERKKSSLKEHKNEKFKVSAPFCCHVVTWFNWWRLLFAPIQKCSTTIKHFPLENHKSIQTRSYLKEIEDKRVSFEVGSG